MKIFENVSQMKLAHLTNGQFVQVKGGVLAGDGSWGFYLVAPSGGGESLASGNVALLQPISSVTSADVVINMLSLQDLRDLAPVTGMTVYLREDGRAGHFKWSSANHVAEVTADTKSGIYVAPASDLTGASGAWVRQYSGDANIKWFGAIGDGATDDLGAFNAAVAFGDVYVPAGVFDLGDNRVITYNSVRGQGTLVLRTLSIHENNCVDGITIVPAASLAEIEMNGDCSIVRNCNITGYGVGVTSGRAGIYAEDCKDAVVQGNTLTVAGIWATGAKNVLISDNRVDGENVYAIDVVKCTSGTGGVIHNNIIKNTTLDGIDIFTSGDKIVITSNKLSGMYTNGIEMKVILRDPEDPLPASNHEGFYVEDVIISNNIIEDIRGAASDHYSGIKALLLDERAAPAVDRDMQSRNVLISGNIIRNVNYAPSGSDGEYTAIHAAGVGYTITDNNIYDIFRGAGTELSGTAIKLANAKHTIVSNNQLVAEQVGIKIDGETDDTIISGNVFGKNYQSGQEIGFRGMYITGAVDRMLVQGNMIHLADTATDGMLFLSGIGDVKISDNFIRGRIAIPSGDRVSIANNNIERYILFGTSGIVSNNIKIIGNILSEVGDTSSPISMRAVSVGNATNNVSSSGVRLMYLINSCEYIVATGNTGSTTNYGVQTTDMTAEEIASCVITDNVHKIYTP